MTTLLIEGRKVKVSDDFASMSPEEQERTVEEIASSLNIQSQPQGERVMAQTNAGIAETLGGAVDFLNPFDKPHALNPFPNGTGSAVQGLTRGMEAVGAPVSGQQPQTAGQAFMRGVGNAAGAAPLVAGGAAALGRAGGMVGRVADDSYNAMMTGRGLAGEALAGGISRGAEKGAENAGAPEWVQQIAAIAAPVGALAAGNIAARGSEYLPVVRGAKAAGRAVNRTIAPFTKSGATEVARQRVQSLVGGRNRAEDVADMIGGENPLGLSPAQQTGDPNLLGLEVEAARDPLIREALDAQATRSTDAATRELRAGAGEVDDARQIFEQQRQDFAETLNGMVDDRLRRAVAAVDALDPRRESSANSAQAVDAVNAALDDATALEAQLWARVEQSGPVPIQPSASRARAEQLVQSTAWPQQGDIPQKLRTFLDVTEGGGTQTVKEMHALYSEMRRVARSAMAGNDQNKNLARIANDFAETILRDLGTDNPQDEIGQAINSAREYSRALHETFDRGAAGQILKRTLDGDTTVEAREALDRTVGRGGTSGDVDAEQIINAGGFAGQDRAAPFVEDYLRGMVQNAMRDETGAFTSRAAARFSRDNAELLKRFPGLREDMREAVAANDDAAAFATRVKARLEALETKRKSAVARFLDGPSDRAIKAVTQARNPAREASKLVNAAKKDPSGEALAGLKDAFSAYMIGGDIDAASLAAKLDDKRFSAALSRVYSPVEMNRFRVIARELAKVQGREANAANVGGSLSGAEAPRLIRVIARVFAANNAGAISGNSAGASLQTAQIASGTANDLVNSLTRDRASQMIADAIQDPDLMRLLLTDPGSTRFEVSAPGLLLPYLIGAGSAATATE